MNAKDLSIQKISIHPKYNGESAYYDLAIFETEPIALSNFLSPVCLPSEPSGNINRYDNYYVELTGWGTKSKLGKVSQRLKRVSLQIFKQR